MVLEAWWCWQVWLAGIIELEHSTLSLEQASTLCCAGLQLGITSFVLFSVCWMGCNGCDFPYIHNKSK